MYKLLLTPVGSFNQQVTHCIHEELTKNIRISNISALSHLKSPPIRYMPMDKEFIQCA